jgi:hypothetical protein
VAGGEHSRKDPFEQLTLLLFKTITVSLKAKIFSLSHSATELLSEEKYSRVLMGKKKIDGKLKTPQLMLFY